MRATLLALAATVAACVVSEPPPIVPVPGSFADVLASDTVALVDGSRAYCSGVWVGGNEILTAAHCVADKDLGADVNYAQREDVWHVDGAEVVSSHTAQLARRDAAHDLAMLHVVIPYPHGVAAVSARSMWQGERVYTMGHPLGLWWSYSSGEIAAFRWSDDGELPYQWWIQTTAPISPGNSGCGLYDSRGDLLGIAHGYYPAGENLNLFVARDYIAAFVAGK
jgi:S1-C subfamily serine protease